MPRWGRGGIGLKGRVKLAGFAGSLGIDRRVQGRIVSGGRCVWRGQAALILGIYGTRAIGGDTDGRSHDEYGERRQDPCEKIRIVVVIHGRIFDAGSAAHADLGHKSSRFFG